MQQNHQVLRIPADKWVRNIPLAGTLEPGSYLYVDGWEVCEILGDVVDFGYVFGAIRHKVASRWISDGVIDYSLANYGQSILIQINELATYEYSPRDVSWYRLNGTRAQEHEFTVGGRPNNVLDFDDGDELDLVADNAAKNVLKNI